MHDELSKRQAAIRWRRAGETVDAICQAIPRTERWFHTWWKRDVTMGPAGLYELTRAHQHVVNRTPPPIERAVVSLRRRLAARAPPPSRSRLVGAPHIRAELEALGHTPLPGLRTIDRTGGPRRAALPTGPPGACPISTGETAPQVAR